MKILIAFGTTEGQTRKIARFCSDWLTDSGHSVELLNVSDGSDIDISRFEAAILAGSIHTGKFQQSLEHFIIANLTAIQQCETLFLSVSLAAAGNDPDDHTGLDHCISNFNESTGWKPDRLEHVAGAFRFTSYDFFRYWAMRWIASRRDSGIVDPHSDKEYTDWDELTNLLEEWTNSLSHKRL